MEVCYIVLYVLIIRIEPDWNVKDEKERLKAAELLIRIEPDWNVKIADVESSLVICIY